MSDLEWRDVDRETTAIESQASTIATLQARTEKAEAEATKAKKIAFHHLNRALKAERDLYFYSEEWGKMEMRLQNAEAEVAALREALTLYSCADGCNECPEHERDRVNCGWTARAALAKEGQ